MTHNNESRPSPMDLTVTMGSRWGHGPAEHTGYFARLVAEGARPELAEISAALVAAGDACAADIDEWGLNAVLLVIHTDEWSQVANDALFEAMARYWAGAGGWLVDLVPRVGIEDIESGQVRVLVTFADEPSDPLRALNEIRGAVSAACCHPDWLDAKLVSAEYDESDWV